MKIQQQYALYTIAGTEEFVLAEVKEKLGNSVQIALVRPGRIELEWVGDDEIIPENDSDSGEHQGLMRFSSLLSPTHTAVIGNESHKIKNEARDWRVAFIGSGGINPALGYVMCAAAAVKKDELVYDPFCGSGVIPISAMLYFGAAPIWASDLSGRAISATQANVNAAQIKKRTYNLFRSNISMVKLKDASVDKVITNMPFGIRVGRHDKNKQLYQLLINKMQSFLKPTGSATILTTEKKLLENAAKDKFKVKEITIVRQSGLNPSIFQLTPINEA